MQRSETISELAKALAQAQGEIENAKKDSNNPHFKSKYADLSSVWDACRGPLSKHGLAVIQTPGSCEGGRVSMTTLLTHASGEWISEILEIPLAKVDAQGYGSAVTYARRYALAAMVGIAPDDDDGNAASNPKGANNDAKPLSQKQLDELQILVAETGTDLEVFCTYYKIDALPALPSSKFEHAKNALSKKLDGKANDDTPQPEKEAA